MPIVAASMLTTAESYFYVSVTEQSLPGRDGITPTEGYSDGTLWKSEL